MSAKITVGGKAPGFTLPHDGGGEVSLADFKGRKLVLYFYPKADTPGCTVEAMDFSRLAPAFAKAGTDDPRRFGRPGRQAGQVQDQARPFDPARLRRNPRNAGGLWGLGREIDVRPQATWASCATPT